MRISFSQHNLLQKLSCPLVYSWHPCQGSVDYGFISELSVLFHWSKCLSLCQYHTVLITIILETNSTSSSPFLLLGVKLFPGPKLLSLSFFKGLFCCLCVCVCVCCVCGSFLKSLFNLLQYCFCFIFWFLSCMRDLSFLTRDWTHTLSTGRQSLTHWTAREVPWLAILI